MATLQGVTYRSTEEILSAILNYIMSANQLIEIVAADPLTDALVSAQGPILASIERILDYTRRTRSLQGYQAMQEDGDYKIQLAAVLGITVDQLDLLLRQDLERFTHDLGVTPLANGVAQGVEWFYRKTAPVRDIFIASATSITTRPDLGEEAVDFVTTAQAQMLARNADSYLTYAPLLARPGSNFIWKIDVPIVAANAGSSGNQSAGKITELPGGVSEIDGVYNPTPTRGGLDLETDPSLIRRASLSWSGREIAARDGLIRFALDQGLQDAWVVKWADKEMTRDGGTSWRKGWGGMVDLWIQGESGQGIDSEVQEGTALRLSYVTRLGIRYTQVDVFPLAQPVIAAGSITVTNLDNLPEVLSPSGVTLMKDTGAWLGSYIAKDRIRFFLEGVYTNLSVTYSYTTDRKPAELQSLLLLPENDFGIGDVLAKAAIKSPISIQCQLAIFADYDKPTVFNNVVTAVSNFVNSLGVGGRKSPSASMGQQGQLSQSDVAGIIELVPGMDRIVPDSQSRFFTVFDRRPGSASTDLVPANNEYLWADADTFLNVTYV